MYKGQGLDQRELVTCAYWEFLAHGQKLQGPIPGMKAVGARPHVAAFIVARVERALSLSILTVSEPGEFPVLSQIKP